MCPDFSMRPDLAYVLGVLFGDGSAYKTQRNYKLDLVVKDSQFAHQFYQSLKILGLNAYRSIKLVKYKGERRPYYRVGANSKAIYMLKKEGVPRLESEECQRAFIKGFYESEGSSGIAKIKDRRLWRVRFANSDFHLLKTVQTLLSKVGFKFGLCLSSRVKKSYELTSRKYERNREFMETIQPCIKNYQPLREVLNLA